MKKRIKLTEKDLQLRFTSRENGQVERDDRGYTDTTPLYCVETEADDCPETKKCDESGFCNTTIGIGCEQKTVYSVCGCLNPQTNNCNTPRTYRGVECAESKKNCPETGNYCPTLHEVCKSDIAVCESDVYVCIAESDNCLDSTSPQCESIIHCEMISDKEEDNCPVPISYEGECPEITIGSLCCPTMITDIC